MRLYKKIVLVLAVCIAASGFFSCATPGAKAPGSAAHSSTASTGALLSSDSAVHSGMLENGMKWSVLQNGEPKNRIYLRLAVKAGSVLEDDDQKGLAHLIEHMAFNGTEHFERNELVNYFETIGMAFGPEVNAYTSFDETVYMLEIPADDPAALEKALLVIHDWACAITFDPAELEKERGVVIEEWRLGRGANGRVQDESLPFILEGSLYAGRLPIGDPEIVKTAARERVTDFYRTWYRPELMSVTVVGDADPALLEQRIREALSTIPASTPAKAVLPSFAGPKKARSAVLVVKDPELTYTTVQILEPQKPVPLTNRAELKRRITEQIAYSILNSRLSEKVLASDPLILGAMARSTRFARPVQFSYLAMVPSNGRFDAAFKELLVELLRFEKFGATAAELEREKSAVLEQINQQWLEREKAQSSFRADAITDEWLYGDVMLSIQDTYDLYNEIVPSITGGDILSSADDWFDGRGTRLVVTAPESATDIPDEKALFALWQSWKPAAPLTPYVEAGLDRPLFTPEAAAGAIASEKIVSKNGITELVLSNGVRVLLYPTDFKANEIVFTAISKGGSSLVSDADYPSAAIADAFAEQSGLNGFSSTDLEKKLAGQSVTDGIWINDFWEGIHGSSSSADLETLFQLVNLRFTKPHFTNTGWQSLYAQLKSSVDTRDSDPDEMFADLKVSLLYGDNIRYSNLDAKKLALMDPSLAETVYRQRFADASDFIFVFAGSFDAAQIREFCAKYLAVLPAAGIKEEPRNIGVPFPKGKTAGQIEMGLDPKSQVFMAFGGKAVIKGYEYEIFNSLCSLLEIRLREVVREDMGGSYGVSVNGTLSLYPEPHYEIEVSFGCEPGREQELSKAVLAQMEWIQSAPVPETYLIKLKEAYRRSFETGLRNNAVWVNMITGYLLKERPLDSIGDIDAVTSLFTPDGMQAAAKKYFNTENYVQAYLLPQKKAAEAHN